MGPELFSFSSFWEGLKEERKKKSGQNFIFKTKIFILSDLFEKDNNYVRGVGKCLAFK